MVLHASWTTPRATKLREAIHERRTSYSTPECSVERDVCGCRKRTNNDLSHGNEEGSTDRTRNRPAISLFAYLYMVGLGLSFASDRFRLAGK